MPKMLSFTSTPSIRNTLSYANAPDTVTCEPLGVLLVRPGASSATRNGLRPVGQPIDLVLLELRPAVGRVRIDGVSATTVTDSLAVTVVSAASRFAVAAQRHGRVLGDRPHVRELEGDPVGARRQSSDDVGAVDVGHRRSLALQGRRRHGHGRTGKRQTVAAAHEPGQDPGLHALREQRCGNGERRRRTPAPASEVSSSCLCATGNAEYHADALRVRDESERD